MAAAAAAGAWWAAALWSGVTEPWDAPSFWTLLYPAALLGCALLGLVARRPWRLALVGIGAQIVPVIAAGGGGTMLVFSFAIAVLLAVPGMVVAQAARWLALRLRPPRRD